MARQATMNVGFCEHRRTEPIVSEGGKEIGERCAVCAKVLGGYGACASCKRDRLLTVYVAAHGGSRHCSDACRLGATKAKREGKPWPPKESAR